MFILFHANLHSGPQPLLQILVIKWLFVLNNKYPFLLLIKICPPKILQWVQEKRTVCIIFKRDISNITNKLTQVNCIHILHICFDINQ